MGMVLETQDPILGLEQRRESFYVFDQTRKPDPDKHCKSISEHIFAYDEGYVELSNEFLKKLVKFFDKPKNRALLEGYGNKS